MPDLGKLPIRERLFSSIQVFTLYVFNKRKLCGCEIIGRDNNNRNLSQARKLCRAESAFARNNLVKAVSAFPHNQRLKHAVCTN